MKNMKRLLQKTIMKRRRFSNEKRTAQKKEIEKFVVKQEYINVDAKLYDELKEVLSAKTLESLFENMDLSEIDYKTLQKNFKLFENVFDAKNIKDFLQRNPEICKMYFPEKEEKHLCQEPKYNQNSVKKQRNHESKMFHTPSPYKYETNKKVRLNEEKNERSSPKFCDENNINNVSLNESLSKEHKENIPGNIIKCLQSPSIFFCTPEKKYVKFPNSARKVPLFELNDCENKPKSPFFFKK